MQSKLCWFPTLFPMHLLQHHQFGCLLTNLCQQFFRQQQKQNSLHRFSFVSVSFTFNASLNASAPACSMRLTATFVCELQDTAFSTSKLVTTKIKLSQSSVLFQCFAQCSCSFISNLIHCFTKDNEVFSPPNQPSTRSHSRLRSAIDVFVFNT